MFLFVLRRCAGRGQATRRGLDGGMTDQDIAEHLVLSPLTAKTHVSSLFLKLGVRDQAQLVVTAFQTGPVGRD